MKRIGIFAGSFDPVHAGHLAFANEAIRQCGLDKVFFLIEPRPRRKQGVKALVHRSEMVRLAIKDEHELGNIILQQQRFTPEKTLPVLMELFKGAKIHLLLGDDVLAHLASWPHVEDLLINVKFVVGIRNFEAREVKRRLKILQETRGFAVKYELFQASMPEFSSSKIRQSIKKGHIPKGLRPQVFEYISEHNLYADAGDWDSDVASSDNPDM